MSLSNWKHWLIEDAFANASEETRRLAKLILVAVLSIGCWGPFFVLLFWWLNFKEPALIVLLGNISLWTVPFIMRQTRSITIAGNVIVGLFALSIGSITWFVGGLKSPVLYVFIAVGMVAWLLTSDRWRMIWLIISTSVVLLFFFVEYFITPNPYSLPPKLVLILQPTILLAIAAICISVVWFFERLKREAMAQQEKTNLQLKDNQKELVKLTHDLAMARDEAVKADRAKSTFLANMSHELRTPLNAIMGYSELLLEDAEDMTLDELKDDLRKINNSGDLLLSLISDVLDLSKIEAGHIEIHAEEFALSSFIGELRQTVHPLAEKNDNQFQFVLPEHPIELFTDQMRLRQILLNLISNACKFTHEGTITLCIKPFTKGGDDWMCFQVQDTGIGMTEEQLKRIFEAFTQADHLTSRKYGGTGLGLSISKKLAKLLGGNVYVSSIEGRGSIFSLKLPLTLPKEVSVRKRLHKTTTGNVTSFVENRPLILVIDDDHNVHDMLIRILRRENYNVVTAFDGEEGLRLAKELNPSVITLDALMPGMTGWDVLSSLKSTPQLAGIPVIMLSIADEIKRGYTLGAAEYLTKPIDRERLLSILGQFRELQRRGPILIVEDDPATRELLERTLQRHGWPTLSAQNGVEALDRLQSASPSLILSDLMMPEMDGFELIEKIAEHNEWKHIPVVVLTAMELSQHDSERLRRHIEDILRKGSSPFPDLEAKLLTLLEDATQAPESAAV